MTTSDPVLSFDVDFKQEAFDIADWWLKHTIDQQNGGFYAQTDAQDNPLSEAAKHIILNTRILYFFSEIARFSNHTNAANTEDYRNAAQRSFDYIEQHFVDKVHGGVVWEVSATGKTISDRKQTFAQAFYLYALCAFYKLNPSDSTLTRINQTFSLLESQVNRDGKGYVSAFTADWQPLEHKGLDPNDINATYTLDTELHVLEAYSALFEISPNAKLAKAMRDIIARFETHYIDDATQLLNTHFDDQYRALTHEALFGHNVECAWLILHAVGVLEDAPLAERWNTIAVSLIDTAIKQGMATNQYLCDSVNLNIHTQTTSSTWWVQAEALIALLYANQITKDDKYLHLANNIWRHIAVQHKDNVRGEWHWFSHEDRKQGSHMYKVGPWKGPYHNGRAMLMAHSLVNQARLP